MTSGAVPRLLPQGCAILRGNGAGKVPQESSLAKGGRMVGGREVRQNGEDCRDEGGKVAGRGSHKDPKRTKGGRRVPIWGHGSHGPGRVYFVTAGECGATSVFLNPRWKRFCQQHVCPKRVVFALRLLKWGAGSNNNGDAHPAFSQLGVGRTKSGKGQILIRQSTDCLAKGPLWPRQDCARRLCQGLGNFRLPGKCLGGWFGLRGCRKCIRSCGSLYQIESRILVMPSYISATRA